MSLEWEQVIVDSLDPPALGRWWCDALGWVVVNDDPREFEIRAASDRLPGLLFVGDGSDEPKTSKNRLQLNYGTLYPALLKLEQEGFIKAEWRQSENNRRAKFYGLTAAGRKQLARETAEWHETADLIAAFLAPWKEAP